MMGVTFVLTGFTVMAGLDLELLAEPRASTLKRGITRARIFASRYLNLVALSSCEFLSSNSE